MKFVRVFGLLCGLLVAASANSTVCHPQGKITSIIPSSGDAGFAMDVEFTECSCDYNIIWIDTDTDGGKAMYSAALSAKISSSTVKATIEDDKGQGASGNDSITYRFWGSCQLKALQVF
jgi:hypothetical protein